MAKTYMDAEGWTSAESWRTIRTVRASPPARFARQLSGARKQVFHAGLEQAQQQYAAAALIGYDSRPLNLFYGLSQAGRAIAAASPDLRGSEWNSNSHGLRMTEVQSRDVWLSKLKIEPAPSDTFSRASIALDSATDGDELELGALAAHIPHFLGEFRNFRRWPEAVVVSFDSLSRGTGGTATMQVSNYGEPATADTAALWAARYPDFDGFTVRDISPAGTAIFDVRPPSRVVPISGYNQFTLDTAREYGLREYAFPAAGASRSTLHPIATWWLLLYGFSMIARYHPREWTNVLDIRHNAAASQIEYLLDLAVTAVPEALARHFWDSPWARPTSSSEASQ